MNARPRSGTSRHRVGPVDGHAAAVGVVRASGGPETSARALPTLAGVARAARLAALALAGCAAFAAGCDEAALRLPEGASTSSGPTATSAASPGRDVVGDGATVSVSSFLGERMRTAPPTDALGCADAVGALASLARPDPWQEAAARPVEVGEVARYVIDQRIDTASGRIIATMTVDFPNPTQEPLAAVPVLLHANSARELGARVEASPWLEVTAIAATIPAAARAPRGADWVSPVAWNDQADGATDPSSTPGEPRPRSGSDGAAPPGAPRANAGGRVAERRDSNERPADQAPRSQLVARIVRPTLLLVELPTPIAPGQRGSLHVRYVAHVRQLMGAPNDMFAQSLGAMSTLGPDAEPTDYGLLAVGDGLLTEALAYPVVAPYRDGGFDTDPPTAFGDVAYANVAEFVVRTELPPGVRAVTNLVDAYSPAEAAGASVLCSAGTFVRDFVLVAGTDLAAESVQHGPVRVRSVYRERDREAGRAVLDAAVSALQSYERHFGPYPYSELDVVESSLVGGAGGVEFSALVLVAGMLYRSPEDSSHPLALAAKLSGSLGGGLDELLSLGGLLGTRSRAQAKAAPDGGAPPPERDGRPDAGGPRPDDPTAVLAPEPTPPDPTEWLHGQLDRMREFTVAHEVAHQYFAGIVGNDTRRHPSLDEPLAQYAALVAMEDRHGREAGQRAWNANVTMNYAVYRLLGGVDRKVLRDTSSFANPLEYTALVYGKAPQLYLALRDALGREPLHRAMRAAISRHRFRLLTTEQWIEAIEQAAGDARRGVRPIFRRWLEQTHADADLGIDDDGDRMLELAFGPEQAALMRESFGWLGISPRELFKAAAGGGLDASP